MHRLSRSRLIDIIAVTLATASRLTRAKLASKRPIEADQGRLELAELIAGQIDNASSMVIVTEMVGEAHVARPGKWDADEARPCD
jgi:hypothetical protein